VWSLVVPHLILAPVQAVAAFAAAGWRPGWDPQVRLWAPIVRYSAGVIGSAVTAFIISEGDTLLVGRVMGPAPLGVYNLAWRSSNLVSRNVVNLSNKLAFPVLAAASGDRARMADTLRTMLRIVSGVTFPLLVALFVLADDFIYVVYGAKWHDAVLPLRILIVYAIRYSIGSPLGPVFNAIGRPDLVFKLQSAIVPIYCVAIWFGSAFGIVGVAVAVTVVRTAFGAVTFRVAAAQLGVRVSYLLEPMRSSFTASLLTGSLMFGASLVLDRVSPEYSVLKLVLLGAIGALMYVWSIRRWFPDLVVEIRSFVTGRTRTPVFVSKGILKPGA
jgi:O-antigen/teichoic acid export membrane protein